MKTCCLLPVLVSLFVRYPVHGQDAEPTPSPPLVALAYPATDGIGGATIPDYTALVSDRFYVYGGQPLTLSVTARAPLGTHLRIYADVYQWTGSTLMPWQHHTPVSEEIVFGDRTSVVVDCKLPELRAVQRKTHVSVILHPEPRATAYPGGFSIQGFVYPREEPGEWQKRFSALLTRAGIRQVAFFGLWKNPAHFLRENKIAFNDLGDDWPARPDAHTLYIASGVVKSNENGPLLVPGVFGEARGVRLVLFEPWDIEVMPPGVYQTAGAAGGGVWKVTLPDLFAGFGSNDPRHLEILTTLFEQVLPSRPPATAGDDPEPTPMP